MREEALPSATPLSLALSHAPFPPRVAPAAQSLLEDVETQKLVMKYLEAAALSFLCEDVLAVGLSSWRLWRVCRLTGLTLRDSSQVTMLLQLMFSALMAGYQVGGMKEKLRLGGLQLRKEAKLATVIKASTTGKGFRPARARASLCSQNP